MDRMQRLRNVAVTLFIVSPFFVLGSLIWVSLLADLGSTDTFATHYKSLLSGSPLLFLLSQSLVYSFSILIITIFVSIILAAHQILKFSVKAKWFLDILTALLILVGVGYPLLILLHTPPDGYYILIFFAVLAYWYTQLRKYNNINLSLRVLRIMSLPSIIGVLAMIIIVVIAVTWLLVFWQNSISLNPPWLSNTTLLFMVISSLVMAVATIWPVVELVNSLKALRLSMGQQPGSN